MSRGEGDMVGIVSGKPGVLSTNGQESRLHNNPDTPYVEFGLMPKVIALYPILPLAVTEPLRFVL